MQQDTQSKKDCKGRDIEVDILLYSTDGNRRLLISGGVNAAQQGGTHTTSHSYLTADRDADGAD